MEPDDRPSRLEVERDEAELAAAERYRAAQSRPDEMLRLAREANRKSKTAPDFATIELAVKALEHYADLDEWLSKGGFRPAVWIPTGRAADVGHEIPDLPDDEPSPEAIQRLVDAAPDLNPTALAILAKVCRQLEHALRAEEEDELRAWLRTIYRTALQNDDAIDGETGLARREEN